MGAEWIGHIKICIVRDGGESRRSARGDEKDRIQVSRCSRTHTKLLKRGFRD